VLVLDQFSQPGGAQHVLLDLLSAFRTRRWSALVALPGGGPLFDRIHSLGFATRVLEHASHRTAGRFFWRLPALSKEIGDALRSFEPDLLYINGPRLLPATALTNPRVPVVFHSHSLVRKRAGRTLCGIALAMLRAHVIAVCRFTASQWRVPPSRMRVIYNGVAWPSPARVNPTRPLRVGCIGRISPEKGQLEFVHAARLIHATLPHCRFSVIGDAVFGDAGAVRYANEVRSAAAGLPIEFPGWINDVQGSLRDLDLLLVPSGPGEATTRVIPEAWAAGVPVVAFPSGGIPEILVHGSNGYLAASPREMAAAAVHLLSPCGSEERAFVVHSGFETWQSGFTLEGAQQRWLDTITSLTSERSTTSVRQTRPGEVRT
jgi:glycosyltransferase involved in cell wall biosynthesis